MRGFLCKLYHPVPRPLIAVNQGIDVADLIVFLDLFVEHHAGGGVLVAKGYIGLNHVQLVTYRELADRVPVPPRFCKVAVFKLTEFKAQVIRKDELHFMRTDEENIDILICRADLMDIGLLNCVYILRHLGYRDLVFFLDRFVPAVDGTSDL